MGVIALLIGGTVLSVALVVMAYEALSMGSKTQEFSNGALSDGDDASAQTLLLDEAEALGLDAEEYDTWWDLEQAINDKAAEAAEGGE